MNSTWRILVGYLLYIAFGTIMFMLPMSQVSGEGLSVVDALFIAVSGISGTGLSPIPVTDMTIIGQVVLLTLIFFGGLGYMTFTAFISVSIRGTMTTSQHKVMRKTFALPNDINLGQFVLNIGIYALIVQIIGAILLFFVFQDDPRANPVWSAIFHSVSSFGTAGFSIYPNGLESYSMNGALNLIVSTICLLGSIGFIVATDVGSVLRGHRQRITLTTRVVLILMATFISGAIGLMLFFGGVDQGEGLYHNFLITSFHVVNAITSAGFNTIPLAEISGSFALILMILMTIGGAPSGTSGGMKITTISAVFAAIRSFIVGDKQVTMLKRVIPQERVRVALSTATVYMTMLLVGYLLLLLVEGDLGFRELLFEAVSGLGTAGLSMGITSQLGDLGKLVIALMMYMGRVGVLTIMATILVQNRKRVDIQYEDVAV
ncbi:MAG: TrkH family potassium uptake protein [Culicoidibacterales bacterium]